MPASRPAWVICFQARRTPPGPGKTLASNGKEMVQGVMHTPVEHAPPPVALLRSLVLGAVLCGCATPPAVRELAEPRAFYPPPPVEARIQFLCHLHGTQDFAVSQSPFLEFLVGKPKEVHRTIIKPFGVILVDHKVMVADTAAPRIVMLDMQKRTFEQFGRQGRGALRKPINIRRGPEGRLYVTDTLRNQVVVFDTEGTYIGSIGDGEEFRPSDVAVTGDEVYILDTGKHSIKVYDKETATLKRTLGELGMEPGQFRYPTNMVLDGDGNLLVSDSMNFRVQKISPQGEVLLQYGDAGDTVGAFSRPRGIAVDREGIAYVVDSMTCVVQMFNAEGQVLMHIGQRGYGPGGMLLPAQVYIDYDHVEDFREYIDPNFDAEYLIFVTNQVGVNKVSVYAFGRLNEPAPGALP